MVKSLLLTFIAFWISMSAHASLKFVSHEDYVHMSEKQKEDFAISLMEYMVELENQYQLETAKYGYSNERFQKFKRVVQEIQSALLMGNAYAKPETLKSWDQLAENFRLNSRRARGKGNENGNCIFAGWISKTKLNTDGTAYCAHPGFVVEGGGRSSECSSRGKNWIQCNPVIFGYKKESEKSLFCVKTNNQAENSSFECMKEALKENSPGADPKSKRLAFLKNKFSNPKVFENIFDFNYKTCVCSVAPDHFNRDYHNYMRPNEERRSRDRYRTCVGMLNMMNEIQNQCRPDNFDQSIFKQFEQFISAQKISGKDADDSYERFIKDELKSNKQSAKAYNNICSDQLTIEEEPKQEPKEEPKLTTDTPKSMGPKVEVAPEVPKKEEPKKDGPSAPGKTYVCNAKCSLGSEATPAAKCEYDVSEKDQPDAKLSGAKPEKDPSSKEEKSITVKHDELPGKEISCDIEWTDAPEEKKPLAPEVDPTLTLTVTEKGSTHYTVAAQSSNDEGWTFSWKINAEGITPEKGWSSGSTETFKPKTPSGLSVDNESDTDDNNKKETAIDDNKKSGGDNKVTKQKRESKTYQVCGVLSKGDKKKEQCASIDPVTTAGPAAMPSPLNQNPGMIRRASDTSAMGIK